MRRRHLVLEQRAGLVGRGHSEQPKELPDMVIQTVSFEIASLSLFQKRTARFETHGR